MRRIFTTLIFLSAFTIASQAQQGKSIMKESIPVSMFQASYAFHFPALDNKTTYGVSNTIGGGFMQKTKDNWLFGVNGHYIFGPKVKGDRIDILGEGITTIDGEVIGGSGNIASLSVAQRGFHFQGEIGRLIPCGINPNCGFFIKGGIGCLRNRIRIDYETQMYNTPYQVDGDYKYGYDQMRGGIAFHLETGYLLLNDTRMLNCAISLEMTWARTHNLRSYDFRVFDGVPVGYVDQHKRFNDLYYGIRFTWNIPTYQRQPEAYYYN